MLNEVVESNNGYWAKYLIDNGLGVSIASQLESQAVIKGLLEKLPKNWVCYQHKTADSQVLICTYEDSFCFMAFFGVQSPSTKPKYDVPNSWVDSALTQSFNPEKLANFLRCDVDEEFLNGPVVCSCFSVREKTISKAIVDGCSSVSALGDTLKCGTNCGSCKPALATLINEHATTVEDVARES